MPSMAHRTTHKVEKRISELNNKSIETLNTTETETQREQILRGKKKRIQELLSISNNLIYV